MQSFRGYKFEKNVGRSKSMMKKSESGYVRNREVQELTNYVVQLPNTIQDKWTIEIRIDWAECHWEKQKTKDYLIAEGIYGIICVSVRSREDKMQKIFVCRIGAP